MASQIVTTGTPAHKIGSGVVQGANSAVFDDGYVHSNWTLQVNYTGTITLPSIQLQGSLDGGTNWYNLGAAYTSTTSGAIIVANSPAQQVRATVAGTTVTVNLFLGANG